MTIKRFERRNFLKKAAQGAAAAAVLAPLTEAQAKTPDKKPTAATHRRTASATPPKPALTLNVRDFGATGDGSTKDTAAIQQALDRCGVLGGGEVVVPAGNYSTGSLALRANTILRLEENADLLGTPDFADYLVTQVRWEGRWIQGHVGLVYAIDADHIGIVGPGKITGNPAVGGRPNTQNPLRHPCVAEFINCNDVRLEDFSTSMHLMWSIHPTNCEHISIKNLTINSTGGNGDGIGIGSEASGGIRNARIEHCKFVGARTCAIYIKSRFGRGAFIEDILGEDLDVSGMKQAFLEINVLTSGIQDQYPVPGLEGIPAVKNLRFSNVRVTDVPVLVQATALAPQKPLDGFTLTNVTGTCEKGIFLANAKDVKFTNIALKGYEGALLNLYNVTGTGLAGAAKVEAPKIPELIPAPETPYQLH